MKEGSKLKHLHGRPYRNIFVALLTIVFVQAVGPNLIGKLHVSDFVISLLIAAAVFETVRNRRHAAVALVLGLPAIITRLATTVLPDTPKLNGAVLFFNALFFGYLIWNILNDILGHRRSTSERIFGALCAYILIGVLFALLYAHLEYRDPGSSAFTSSNPAFTDMAASESRLLPLFVYFSFVTLTTLGYGDITPVTDAARTLAWLEALVGQLYLVVMVAGLVAMHVSQAQNAKPPGDDGADGSGQT